MDEMQEEVTPVPLDKGKNSFSEGLSNQAELAALRHMIREMGTKMGSLTEELKGIKRKSQTPDEVNSKLPRVESSCSKKLDSEPDSDSDNDIDLDRFLAGDNTDNSDEPADYDDLEDFYIDEDEAGENIDDKLAAITNKAIKSKPQEDKFKDLKKRHKRPSNITFLQVPKVDDMLWRQLRGATKSNDYILQRCHQTLAGAAVPVIKALAAAQTSKNTELKGFLSDAFKTLTHGISSNISSRRDRIKRELDVKYKAIANCEASPEKLFGDGLQEKIRSLADAKVNLTQMASTGNKRPFLAKRPGFNWNQQHRFQRNHRPNFRQRRQYRPSQRQGPTLSGKQK